MLHKILEVLLQTAESLTKGAWEPHVALGTAVENHWFIWSRCWICRRSFGIIHFLKDLRK